ncbi:MAG: SEC-C metal-binding domain-containing protein [Peptostreptococcaceae bacterium]
MIGRNDLCICGSKKKYKKCCLNKDNTQKIVNRKVEDAQTKYANLYQKIYNYSIEERFEEEYKRAREIFYILDNKEQNINFERLFNTYFMIDHIMENKKVMTVSYYEENADKINESESNIMRSLFESYVSIYRVKEKRDEEVVLEDCLTNEVITTQDIKLLSGFNVDELIIARILDIEDINVLVDITVIITEDIKNVIINDIDRLYKEYEEFYKEKKAFLMHHTSILYRYVQQLLDPSVVNYLRDQTNPSEEKQTLETTVSESAVEYGVCEVSTLLNECVEDEFKTVCIKFWNEVKEKCVKGTSNGWAAAVEYHIKKENSLNVTQPEIAKKYETSASTLGKRYKDIKA